MSAASIEYAIVETTAARRDRHAVDAVRRDPTARLRRAFTSVYTPRHRADGPAV